MILKRLRDDTRGAALIEFSVTLPFFLLLMFGLIQAGLLLWSQAGLQHGVEVATRCASVNYSALRLGPPISDVPSCFGVAPSDVTTRIIQDYALAHSFGLVPSFSGFTITPTLPTPGTLCCFSVSATCPTTIGYVVTASAPYNLMNYIFSGVTLTTTSKFSITCS
jgi:hypothetical protein